MFEPHFRLSSQIPLSDPRSGVQSCMPFFRSAPSCVSGLLAHRGREQLNAITSFVDASMVYGSSTSLASALRNLSSPLGSMALNSQHSDQEMAYMPFLPRLQVHLDPCGPRNSTSGDGSDRTKHRENNTSCFQAGERVARYLLCAGSVDLLFTILISQAIPELMSIWE